MTTLGRWGVLAMLLAPLCDASAQHALVRVSGSVYDSVRGRPLSDALVQFAQVDPLGSSRILGARSDAGGKFHLDSVAPGKYLVGFFHPVLDSLGVEARGNAVQVTRDGQVIDLAGPSPATLNELLCGNTSRTST